MTIKTNIKAGSGGLATNHNETLVIRSGIKAGRIVTNHNETLRR